MHGNTVSEFSSITNGGTRMSKKKKRGKAESVNKAAYRGKGNKRFFNRYI